jgi:archaellum biogenesis ATPase FlaH
MHRKRKGREQSTMRSFKLAQSWLADLMPEGICVPSNTIISGPAGAGKELISSVIAASWLIGGGSLIHILTNYNRGHAEKLFSYSDVSKNDITGRIVYIDFDPQIKGQKKISSDELQANLLKTDVFEASLDKAKNMLAKSDLGIMTYMTALNMPLFSKTYGTAVFNKYLAMAKEKRHSLFSLSNNIFADKMQEIENAADNVIYVHGTGVMRLSLKIMRMREVPFIKDEIQTPLSEQLISMHLKTIQKMRQTFIPLIKKI